MRRMMAAMAVGGALLFPAPTMAQQPPASNEPAWAVQELVVRPAPAPRLWKLARGGSTVWILGTIELMPKDLKWNSTQVARVIAESDRVLLPPRGSIGLFEAVAAVYSSRLPNKGSLDAALPPDLAAAYRATLVRLGRDAGDHQHDKLAWAALLLRIDLIRFGALTPAEPVNTVRKIAREKNVSVSQIATYRAGATMREMLALPEEEGEAAVRDAVNGVNFALDHGTIAGEAWARGDLARVRSNISADSSLTSLLHHTAAFKAIEMREIDDTVATLNTALEQPGTTFVVIALPKLARRDGALERLRAQGVEITEPRE